MYDRDVMTDQGPTYEISLDLHRDIKKEPIIDYRASTNYYSDILNHWGGIICANFERNKPDFQPLQNYSNNTQVVKALNHIGTVFSSIQHVKRHDMS